MEQEQTHITASLLHSSPRVSLGWKQGWDLSRNFTFCRCFNDLLPFISTGDQLTPCPPEKSDSAVAARAEPLASRGRAGDLAASQHLVKGTTILQPGLPTLLWKPPKNKDFPSLVRAHLQEQELQLAFCLSKATLLHYWCHLRTFFMFGLDLPGGQMKNLRRGGVWCLREETFTAPHRSDFAWTSVIPPQYIHMNSRAVKCSSARRDK
ncbi:uncharacterized protein LOC112996001 [Dromaius novaehollandiae]|uniref:uncharacterized protein LOC112996001 n=1 Tax=Dromaius novaehollandiae TaxID=8790 RepID=UPI00311FB0D5